MNTPTPAISIKNLSKAYKVYEKASDVLQETIFGRGKFQTVHALKDINLDVYPGEVLGILGANGAGKTTLLKVLCGVLTPTNGELTVNGRISQMLELGTGFHPNYSGHENIFLGGFCQGMTKAEIEEKYDEIVAFSELTKDEINRPFKTYSAGMQARLTFAVAIHVNAEILIVDEWLAVGDARFALKCYERIRKFREEGVTVIFVTHNYTTLTEFCDRGIVLKKGEKVFEGDPLSTITAYQEILFETAPSAQVNEGSAISLERTDQFKDMFSKFSNITSLDETSRTGSGAIKITGVSLLDSHNKVTQTLRSQDPFNLIVEYTFITPCKHPTAGVFIRNGLGAILASTGTNIMDNDPFPEQVKGGDVFTLNYGFKNPFAGGNYFVGLAIANQDGVQCDRINNYFMFTVLPTRESHTDVPVHLCPSVSRID